MRNDSGDVDQAHDERGGSPVLVIAIPFARPQQLIDEPRAVAAHQQVFEGLEAAEMELELGVAQPVASRTSRRVKRRSR